MVINECVSDSKQGLMVVGYDAYHDSHNKSVSYGACVSSMDPMCARYYGNVNAHHNAEELSNNFSVNIKSEWFIYTFSTVIIPIYVMPMKWVAWRHCDRPKGFAHCVSRNCSPKCGQLLLPTRKGSHGWGAMV